MEEEKDTYIEFKEYLMKEYGATINNCTRNIDGELFVSVENEDGYVSIKLPEEYQDQEI